MRVLDLVKLLEEVPPGTGARLPKAEERFYRELGQTLCESESGRIGIFVGLDIAYQREVVKTAEIAQSCDLVILGRFPTARHRRPLIHFASGAGWDVLGLVDGAKVWERPSDFDAKHWESFRDSFRPAMIPEGWSSITTLR